MNIDKIINIVRALNEEGAIANVVGGGQIAGTAEAGDDPPVCRKNKKKPTILARGKFPGLRKRWRDGVV